MEARRLVYINLPSERYNSFLDSVARGTFGQVVSDKRIKGSFYPLTADFLHTQHPNYSMSITATSQTADGHGSHIDNVEVGVASLEKLKIADLVSMAVIDILGDPESVVDLEPLRVQR